MRTKHCFDLVAEGDRVAARHRFPGAQLAPMGLHPASGRVLTASYLAIYRIENDHIAEVWAEWDNLSSLKQLGHHNAA
jgi:predicted ester cyclase